jgi:uncharacterized protein YegL
MKEGLTEIVVVLDKSGSMDSIRKDTIGGFNAFLKSQKEEEGEATITLILFDTTYNVIYQSIPIQSAAELTEKTYIPNGGTSLYDSLGISLKMTKNRIESLPEEERPSKVIFAVLTDGEENSSRILNKEGQRKYTKDKIFEKIKKLQEESNYIFLYLGANQDAMQVGTGLGFMANNTVSYEANVRGMTASMDSVNKYTKSYRKSNLSSQAFAASADLDMFYHESLDEIDKKEESKP